MNRPLPPCDRHAPGDPLCHYPNPKMAVVQQAHPADEGMTWQAIRDALLAGAVVAAILYPLFVWLLSLAPAPVPR